MKHQFVSASLEICLIMFTKPKELASNVQKVVVEGRRGRVQQGSSLGHPLGICNGGGHPIQKLILENNYGGKSRIWHCTCTHLSQQATDTSKHIKYICIMLLSLVLQSVKQVEHCNIFLKKYSE